MISRNKFTHKPTRLSGFSLLEVLASVVICTLLFSMVYKGFSAHRNQLVKAGKIRDCSTLLNNKLAQWAELPLNEKIQNSGILDQEKDIRWNFQLRETPQAIRHLSVGKYRIVVTEKGVSRCWVEVLWETDQIQTQEPIVGDLIERVRE